MTSEHLPRPDCLHFRGDVPCRRRKVCWDCDEFAPVPRRALVIKFGAPGDALRTTPLLARLRREGFGEITWICDEASREVLSLAVNIDRLLVFGAETTTLLAVERFDTVFSLDKAPAAAALAMTARAAEKRGFGLNESGRLIALDRRSGYALRLGMDDDLKFRGNRKTVPRILFEMSGYDYAGEEYELDLGALADRPTETREGRLVALNIGVGGRWPTKAWPDDCWVALARRVRDGGDTPVFVGGEAERGLLANFAARAEVESIPPAAVRIFAETLARADAVVSGDSFGLHVALAVRTPVIGLFCSTSAHEIEWFGRGEAVVSGEGPCYNARCGRWPGCMRKIAPEEVYRRLKARLGPSPCD